MDQFESPKKAVEDKESSEDDSAGPDIEAIVRSYPSSSCPCTRLIVSTAILFSALAAPRDIPARLDDEPPAGS